MTNNLQVPKKLVNLSIVFAILMVVCGLLVTGSIRAAVDAKEAPLNPDGFAYEIYRDSTGMLWISDYSAGEVWHVNPDSGHYTVFKGLSGVSDGRIDSSGNLWWSNSNSGAIGRYTPGATNADKWILNEDASPIGIAFDNSGKVWVTDSSESNLYNFDPVSKQLCTYQLPDGGASEYILYHNNHMWMGDTNLGRLIRFNISNNTYTIWTLPDWAYPLGLTIDDSDRIWYADTDLGELGRLNPDNNQLRRYVIPAQSNPQPEPVMLDYDAGKIWYTNNLGSVGQLDPAAASGKSTTKVPTSEQVSPTCTDLGSGTSISVSKHFGQLTWTGSNYPLIHDKNGFMIYELPDGGSPWGVVVNGKDIWFADQGTVGIRSQMLGWMQLSDEPSPSPTATIKPPEGDYLVMLPVVRSGY